MNTASSALVACRACGGNGLIRVVDLGEQFLTGVFPRLPSDAVSKGPLRLVWCDRCHLVQLDHSFNATEMYGDNYGYRSGLNRSMVEHLANKCQSLERMARLESGDVVIDIGSNDGTLLRSYQTKGVRKVGVDPTAGKFRQFYDDRSELIIDFFSRKKLVEALGGSPRAALITSIAMFYDLESPRAFIRDIHDTLTADGLWHFEQSYMPSMLRLNSYDTICHEHLEFYSFTVVRDMLAAEGMKVVDVWMNSVNGGSFAVTAARRRSRHAEASSISSWLTEREAHVGLNNPAIYRDFERRVWEHRQELRSLIDSLNRSGKRIIGCGASTKGNVILQFCGIDAESLVAITDVNEEKWGRCTPGTGIPIISEQDGRALQPDYMLVLPWHFKEGIVQRERQFLERGGRLIFPLPEIEIVGY
jgi:cyclopropane fatty-acyl-phospholipid synthase-like methyltransferase